MFSWIILSSIILFIDDDHHHHNYQYFLFLLSSFDYHYFPYFCRRDWPYYSYPLANNQIQLILIEQWERIICLKITIQSIIGLPSVTAYNSQLSISQQFHAEQAKQLCKPYGTYVRPTLSSPWRDPLCVASSPGRVWKALVGGWR